MSAMTGVVEAITTKDVTTRFGVKPTYSLKVDGYWLKHGFKKPSCNVGDTISFDGETGTYGLETKSVTVTAKGEPGAAPVASVTSIKPSSTGGGSYSARVFPIPALHGDRSIVRQNALARSTELYVGARGGKPFDLDLVTSDLIIRMARQFEAYTAGDLDLAAAKKENELEEKEVPKVISATTTA